MQVLRMRPAIPFGTKMKAPPEKTYEKLKEIQKKYKLPHPQVVGTYWEIRERKESKGLTEDQVVALVDVALKDAKPRPNYPM